MLQQGAVIAAGPAVVLTQINHFPLARAKNGPTGRAGCDG